MLLLALVWLGANNVHAQRTEKPPLHGKHWMAITGKPLAATAGSMIFQQGGNAVDAACAMVNHFYRLPCRAAIHRNKIYCNFS